MNKFYIYLFIALAISSCKENKSETDKIAIDSIDAEINENEGPDFFALRMNVVVEKDDNLTLFYLEEGQDKISKKNSISIPVKGSENFQTLTFRIDKDILPTRLILKFGNEEKYQKMVFDEILISYEGREILIAKENFFWNFNPNKFIDYDRTNFTAIVTEKEGVFNPFFVSRKTLEDRIDLELP